MYKQILRSALLLVPLLLPCVVFGQDIPRNFRVFDALLFLGKPSLSDHGFEAIEVNGTSFWPAGRPANQASEVAIRAYARQLVGRSVQLLCLDIEHWPMYPHADSAAAEATIDKLIEIARWIRAEAPGIKLGFYALPPIRDYWTPVQGKAAAILKWTNYNTRLARLAAEVDVIFPSLYTFYEDQSGKAFQRYAQANIQLAKQYGKPVYVFLWPQYHESNKRVGGQLISGAFWRRQLEAAYERADGIVIWGGWKENWDDDSAWWRSTQDFLLEKGLVRPPAPASVQVR
jgi:hypothetical protein